MSQPKTRRRVPRYQVTEREHPTTAHRTRSLEEVIAHELDHFQADDDPDRCIWWGYSIAAVIRTGRDGSAQVVRFV